MAPPATPNSADFPNPVRASAATLKLLEDLHAKSLEQEAGTDLMTVPKEQFKQVLSDKFIALDQNKCQFVYQLLKATRARTVVEVAEGLVMQADHRLERHTVSRLSTLRSRSSTIPAERVP